MKVKLYLILLSLLTVCCIKKIEKQQLSCMKKIEKQQLIGTWKRTNPRCTNCRNFTEETTFTPDSLVFKIFENKKQTVRHSWLYKFASSTNNISFNNGAFLVDLKIVKLTDTELELQNPNDDRPMKFIRKK